MEGNAVLENISPYQQKHWKALADLLGKNPKYQVLNRNGILRLKWMWTQQPTHRPNRKTPAERYCDRHGIERYKRSQSKSGPTATLPPVTRPVWYFSVWIPHEKGAAPKPRARKTTHQKIWMDTIKRAVPPGATIHTRLYPHENGVLRVTLTEIVENLPPPVGWHRAHNWILENRDGFWKQTWAGALYDTLTDGGIPVEAKDSVEIGIMTFDNFAPDRSPAHAVVLTTRIPPGETKGLAEI